jgi:hypothetical protein
LGAVPKNRIDLLPHYARFVATLNRYMPDIGTELVALVSFIWLLMMSRLTIILQAG